MTGAALTAAGGAAYGAGVHLLFVHNNFPAQFGHLAAELVRRQGWRCTFVTQAQAQQGEQEREVAGIELIRYEPPTPPAPGADPLCRSFDDDVRQAEAVYHRLKAAGGSLRPDLIVGHSGLGPTLFLPELFPGTPLIGYFEDFYQAGRSAMEFRPEWPPTERDRLRARVQNATALLDLESCAAGYTPSRFQHGLLPGAYAKKVRVIHDGVDTALWCPRPDDAGFSLPRVVTYVSRALESLRGFDIFMRVAKRVYESYPDVVFLVVGAEEAAYGIEAGRLAHKTFKEHVLAQDDYDLDRIRFLGVVAPEALARILRMSDLHIYLTGPFALSWSLLDAMACGCVVLASDTPPVREVVTDGVSGILRGFFDVDALASAAVEVLADPDRFQHLARAAEATVRERYSLEIVLPTMIAFYGEIADGGPA